MVAVFVSVPVSAGPPVGINISYAGDWAPELLFADAFKQSRSWSTSANAAAPIDANGWPTQDANIYVWAGQALDMSGTYALSFNGQATVTVSLGGGTISNQAYDPSTNTTTATVTMTKTDLNLTFTNTRLTSSSATNTGITNAKLMRPTSYGAATSYPTSTNFTTPIKNLINKFGTIRFMDFLATNGNAQVNWTDRVPPTYASYVVADPRYGWEGKGCPWEYAVILCNETGKDMWICIPVGATNAYITNVANLIAFGSDGANPYASPQASPVYPPLNSNLKVYVEYSNEVWNTAGGFTQSGTNHLAAISEVNAGGSPLNFDGDTQDWNWAARRTAKRTVEISNIFRNVFGDGAMMTRVRPVLESQEGYVAFWLLQQTHMLEDYYDCANRVATPHPPSYYIYGGGGSAYYNPDNSSDALSLSNIWTSSSFDNATWAPVCQSEAGYCLPVYGKRVAYEGGPSMDNTGHSESIKSQAWADPGMTTCVSSHQTTWDQNGGDLLCYFDSTGDYQWAFAHDPAVLNTPKLLAIDSIDSFAPAAGTYGVAIPGIVTASAYNSPESWAGSNPGNLSANGNWTWTGYIVNNASTGAFLIKLNAGSSGTTNTADIYVDGGLVGTIAIPNTGSSGTYQDSATLSISTLAVGTHGVLLKASSGSCGVNTIIITSDATAAPAFTTQPAGQIVAAGGTATFMAAASGNPAPTYQWQLSTAGGNTWTNLTEAAPYSGTATATLTITSATMAMNGYQYKCQASNSVQSNVASNIASLMVIPAAVTLGVPGSVFTNGFTAVWGSVSGATGYRLDVSTNSSFSSFVSGYQNLDVGDVTSVALSGLSASTTYYYRVRAYASAGIGANSSTVTVTTTANIVISAPLTVSTLAGQPLNSGSSDGTGNAARFYYPSGIAADTAGNLYLADIDNHMIRKIAASTGSVTTLAGLAGNSGSTDGTGSDARFNSPSGVAVDGAGNVYVADTMNNTLRKVTASGVVSTLAGSPGIAGSVDGTGSAALFHGPQGLAIDSSRNLYVADTNNQTIRKVVPSTGVVTTVAGLAGNPGSADGMVDLARFNYPSGIAVDGNGNLYVADTDNHTIRLISVVGLIASPLGLPGSTVVSTLAGLSGNSGGADGTGSTARFNSPSDLAVDSSGNLYVADTENFTIREVLSPSGAVSTLAGLAETSGSTDGLGSAVRFFHPAGIALDNSRNLYVADTDNHTVRVGLLAIAPAIQTQPQSQTVTAGNSVQFTVTASGRPAVTSYQWYFNGMAIGGATSTTYNLSNAQSGNAGNYTVVVSNVVNSVTSNAAILTVNAVTPPPSGGGSGSGGGGGAPSVWFYGTLSLLALARRMLRRQ